MIKKFDTKFNFFLLFLGASCFLSSMTFSSPEENILRKEDPKSSSVLPKYLIRSNELEYKTKTETARAIGNAWLYDDLRTLHADELTHNKRTGRSTAKGHAWIKEPSGDFIFGSYADFINQFQDGYVKDPRVLMTDDSRLAANEAKRINGEKNIFRQAVYSPCRLCKEKPKKAPLWQLKANKVIHSVPDQIMIYHHARLEMFGIPVFYLPYFRHADNTVKRKTGFLMPTYGSSSDLGTLVSTPFYYVINDSKDITVVPIFSAKQGLIMTGEFRHRLIDGEYKAQGSYTRSKDLKKNSNVPQEPSRDRWHIMLDGRYDIDDEHLFTMDINRASDTTYLRRYPVLPNGMKLKVQNKNLTSTMALEQFKPCSYGMIRAYDFQTDFQDTTPTIIPEMAYMYQSDPGRYNDILTLEGDLLVMARKQPAIGYGAKRMQRFSLGGGWHIPYLTKTGHLFSAHLTARGDGYFTQGFVEGSSTLPPQSTTRGRVFPQAVVDWRYPLYTSVDNWMFTLEPMMMVAYAPLGINSSKYPNEDSLNTQIEDTSIFLPNRFNGIDRVDEGSRGVYGVKTALAFPGNRRIELFLGQSIRFDRRSVLGTTSGEDRHGSDIVGRLKFMPIEWFAIGLRTTMHRRTFRPRITETTLSAGKPIFLLSTTHTYQSKRTTLAGVGTSQINWTVSSAPIESWNFSVGETRNLKRHQSGGLSRTAAAVYQDECFKMTVSVYKSKYRDRDLKPSSGITLQFDFKNLGSVSPLSFVGLQTNNLL